MKGGKRNEKVGKNKRFHVVAKAALEAAKATCGVALKKMMNKK